MRPSPLRNPKYIGVLAAVALAILVVGSLVRPTDKAAPTTSESELARLARASERRQLDNQPAYFAVVANDVGPSVLRVLDGRGSAIVWNAEIVVAPRPAADRADAVSVATASGLHQAEPVVRGPHLPLAGLHAAGPATLSPAPRAKLPAQPGDWIVAVWSHEQGRAFATGQFTQSAAVRCGEAVGREVASTLALAPGMAGGGLFDADGGLLAVILPCGDRLAALDVASVDALLSDGASVEGQLLARYGLRLAPITEDEARHFKVHDGLVISAVWSGYPAADAGLGPGDIVRRIDGAAATGPADLQPLLGSTDRDAFVLTVQRGVIAIRVSLSARPADRGASAGLTLSADEGLAIDAVPPGSPAGRAGIRPADRLVRIDRVAPRSIDQAQRLLAASATAPVYVEVRRGNLRWGTLLR